MEEISKEQIILSQEKFLKKKNLEECGICYSNYTHRKNALSCKHILCNECLSQLDSLHCPFCRSEITTISNQLKTIIQKKEQDKRTNEVLRDQITSQYIARYPRVDINLIYSGLSFLEDPLFILELSTKELQFLISNK